MSNANVQQILTSYWPTVFPTVGRLTRHTRRVVNALIMCRTPLLGAHRYTCDDSECGHSVLVNNSCRNRHCPLCQALGRAKWLIQRLSDLLPTNYFHIVFTLPRQLRPLTRTNRREVYRIMFKAASETILSLAADPKRLGGKAGLILMLHTWTQRLTFHPHLHGIIPGGVLTDDEKQWIPAGEKFFLPVKVVGRMFRGKFLAFLKEAYAEGRITWPQQDFDRLVTLLYPMPWHIHLESSFKYPLYVVKYLAAYANRVAISDKRILSLRNDMVRFSYVRRTRSLALPAVEQIAPTEFIQRFMLHILPRGFVKIRYYGLLSNRNRPRLVPICTALLEKLRPAIALALRNAVATELLNSHTHAVPRPCPRCGQGILRRAEWIAPAVAAAAKGGND